MSELIEEYSCIQPVRWVISKSEKKVLDNKRYRERNREKCREYAREYYQKNKEKKKAYQKKYYQENKFR